VTTDHPELWAGTSRPGASLYFYPTPDWQGQRPYDLIAGQMGRWRLGGWRAHGTAVSRLLAADVAGYSRLMGADEVGTLAALKAIRQRAKAEA